MAISVTIYGKMEDMDDCIGSRYGKSCRTKENEQGFCVDKDCVLAFKPTSQPLMIMIRYPMRNIYTLNASATNSKMYLRGNGLGLSWDVGKLMTKTSFKDTWKYKVDFAIPGLAISGNKKKPSGRLQFRVYLNDSLDMLGPNFVLNLPLSTNPRNSNKIPEFWVYPWFFSREGIINKDRIFSPELKQEREILIKLPASYNENKYKKYEILVVNDGQRFEMLIPQLETLMTKRALMREILVVAIPNSFKNRTRLLAVSNGSEIHCKNNGTIATCNGCIKCNSSICPYEVLSNDYRRCYNWRKIPKIQGELYLDFIERQVLPKCRSKYRALNGAENVGIMGYSLSGLLSCHAIWTRPQTFRSAACMSSSFWWPMPANAIFPDDVGFEFVRKTLMQHRDARPRQKIYIDVGGNEGYIMISPAMNATRILASTPYFELNVNLWFYIWNGEYHTFHTGVHRMWIPLIALYGSEGSPQAEKNESSGGKGDVISWSLRFSISFIAYILLN